MSDEKEIVKAESKELTNPMASFETMPNVDASRASAEVYGAILLAKKFPRNEVEAINRILTSCKRRSLAEVAIYSFPRGGKTVCGPSIKLMEMICQHWGNIQIGVREVNRLVGESLVESYCYDIENNIRASRTFTIKHEMQTKAGIKKLTDPRDITDHISNFGARRLRAAILEIIPGDIVDLAYVACEKTLKSETNEPLIDRVNRMVSAFDEISITIPMLEKRLGHKVEEIDLKELSELQKIYTSLKENLSTREDWFVVKRQESDLI